MVEPQLPPGESNLSPLTEKSLVFLPANLGALGKRFPAAVAEIEKSDISGLKSHSADSNQIQIARQCVNKLEWIIREDREAGILPAVLDTFRRTTAEKRSQLYILTGFGAGVIACGLADEIRSSNYGILLLEPDCSRFRAMLGLRDFQSLLENGKFFFAVGDNWLDQAEAALERYRLFTVAELCLIHSDPESTNERRQQAMDQVRELACRKRKLELRMNGEVVRYLDRRKEVQRDTIRKVWLCEISIGSASHTRAQMHLVHRLENAIQDAGCDVRRLEFQDGDYLPPFYPVHSLMEFDPDLILILNAFSTQYTLLGKNFSDRLAVPKVSWFMDAPTILYDQLKQSGLGHHDILVSTDDHWFEDIRDACPQMQQQPVHYLPAAATFEQEGPVDPAWQCKISYVGQVRDFSAIFGPGGFSEPEKEILNRIIEAMIRRPRMRPGALAERASELADLAKKGDLRSFLRLHYSPLIWEATSRHRVRTLTPLADFGLRIYGNPDWQKRVVDTALESCFTGQTVAFEELPRLYRNSEINLNIHHLQSSNCLNIRVFDVPASGGFLITEYMPGIEDCFELDREMVVFRTPNELREKVEYFLDHPDERREIVARGRARVLRDHTYANRWQQLLEIIEKG